MVAWKSALLHDTFLLFFFWSWHNKIYFVTNKGSRKQLHEWWTKHTDTHNYQGLWDSINRGSVSTSSLVHRSTRGGDSCRGAVAVSSGSLLDRWTCFRHWWKMRAQIPVETEVSPLWWGCCSTDSISTASTDADEGEGDSSNRSWTGDSELLLALLPNDRSGARAGGSGKGGAGRLGGRFECLLKLQLKVLNTS